MVSAEQLSRDEVVAFLGGQPGTPEGLEALSGGAWSSAWAYRTGGEELVVRFGPEVSWYEADRMAMAFGGPDLPVPEVREVGTTPSGRSYAISARHHGRFLEDTSVEQAGAIAPTLTRLLVALYRVPAGPDTPVVWHRGASPAASWRKFLLDGLVDDPGNRSTDGALPWRPTRNWPPFPRRSPNGCGPWRRHARSAATWSTVISCTATCWSVRTPAGSRRCSPGSARCAATSSSMPPGAVSGHHFHPGIAAADPLPGLLQAPSVRAEPGALLDAAARHHCYELHIGFTHLGWNIWTGNQADLAATARRLAEVLERGPLLLASVRPSAET